MVQFLLFWLHHLLLVLLWLVSLVKMVYRLVDMLREVVNGVMQKLLPGLSDQDQVLRKGKLRREQKVVMKDRGGQEVKWNLVKEIEGKKDREVRKKVLTMMVSGDRVGPE